MTRPGSLLASRPEVLKQPGGPRILTPHPGEFARLLGTDRVPTEQRESVAVDLAGRCGVVLVLKGHNTLITDGQHRAINGTGNPGMATGGTGDVLAGLIGGLLSKGVGHYEAARMGAYLCGMAGDLAFEEMGYSMTALDVIYNVPGALKDCLELL